MKRFWIAKGLKMLAFAALAIAALGYVVMGLWNAVLPAAAGLHPIGFVQALGLLVLARILFGGFRGRGHPRWHWRSRMQARWQQMSPEEQERLRAAWASRRRCGPA
jgi:hypothetical protein